MSQLLSAFGLMTVAVAIHLFGGLVLVTHLRRQVDEQARNPLLHVFRLVVELFAALLLLHLIQVGLWALLYWWQIGWDLSTALYFSATTYATIGYGDVVPPPEWWLVAVMEGLTGVLMLGWSSALVFAVVARFINSPG